jgi:glycosyltransferase involved in cell wall biosynthesis
MSSLERPLKVVLEMRPAFDGHSGIPQETRLIFRGLCGLQGVDVEGLLQSSNLVTSAGLPLRAGQPAPGFPAEARMDRLSRVVVSFQQHQGRSRPARWAAYLASLAGWAGNAMTGRAVPTTLFEPARFEDFLWQSLFAKSLPPEDFALVTAPRHRLLSTPYALAHHLGAATRWFGGLYPRIRLDGADVLLAETPFPGRPPRGTQLVVRYHDAIPILLPHTIKNMRHHQAAHATALRRNVRDGAWFSCVSEATRRDLIAIVPAAEPRAVTIPNMVSHHFHLEHEPADRVREVIWARRNRDAPFAGGADLPAHDGQEPLRYLLMVATLEPRKNHLALVEAWERLRAAGQADLQLVLVGSLGWGFDTLIKRITPWLERGGLHLLQGVPADDLRLLYRHALATVCPSVAEGFDFPGVESMASGGVVVASDIAVHRDVFGEGCLYFPTQSPGALADTLAGLMQAPAQVHALRQRGQEVAARYRPAAVMPLWQQFLLSIAGPR